MRKILIAAALGAAVLLSSCQGSNQAQPTAVTIPPEQVYTPDASAESYIKIDGNKITITSLSEWSAFNFDGNFSDNCHNFLRMFIEGYSQFDEFSTVKLSNWEIIRDPDTYENDLAFNFTVSESSLDTLPKGTYKTVVKDAIDCYMTFEGDAPNAFVTEKMFTSEASKAIGYYLTSYYSWYLPEYGTATKTLPLVNYIVDAYGESGDVMTLDNFNLKVKEIFGISPNKEEIKNLISTKNGTEYVTAFPLGGNASFVIVDEEIEDDKTVITVQFFADCNKFIKSDAIEYYVSKDSKLLGCKVITSSEYKPYGLTNKFYSLAE